MAAAMLLLAATPATSSPAGEPVRAAKGRSSHSWLVAWRPVTVVNGSPVAFRVKAPTRLTALSGQWLGHTIPFSYDNADQSWYALGGVSLETRPRSYELELSGTTQRDSEITFSRRISVRAARYPRIAVSVARRFTEPTPEQLQRINQDKITKQDVFRQTGVEREWSGSFHAPVEARISDVFGTRRMFNGKVQSLHQGLDYGVPPGTPVSAVNSGTVLLAGPLYFEGNCIVLDHGQGLLSLYLHLSEVNVKQGEKVERGQEIGRSGGTGRASGPHLHLAVRWQGVYLNPATLLALRLP